MELETLTLKQQETDDRSKRNAARIKELEDDYKALNQLATSVAVMAEQLKNMSNSVDSLSTKVSSLEAKPGKRYDGIVDKVIWAVLAAVLAFLLARLGF